MRLGTVHTRRAEGVEKRQGELPGKAVAPGDRWEMGHRCYVGTEEGVRVRDSIIHLR